MYTRYECVCVSSPIKLSEEYERAAVLCQRPILKKRNAPGFERAKQKTTSCVPYKREERVSSTIITFCPVNLDKNNLRKRTSVHLLLGQATLIVDKKGSTKIDFNKFARRLFREKTKGFYNIEP